LKSANELLDEILRCVRPQRGSTVVLTQVNGEPNWVVSTGMLDEGALGRFNTKIVDLRKSDPCVDWSAVPERKGGRRQIVKWLSALEG
jgi:hypothetical protein